MNRIHTQLDIETAHNKIEKFIHRTPILTSSSINNIFSTSLLFKCENFQKAGAFKMRGATNAILSLDNTELVNGVATHSSGNHAGALALAAQKLGVPSYIAMPNTAPKVKISAVKSYGGNITFCKPTLEDRERTLKEIVRETSAMFIHPYDDYRIITGQATCAKEIYEEISKLDYIIAPVGGGGLLSGSILSTHFFSETTKVIGAEPRLADDAYRSLQTGIIQPPLKPLTIADGLRTALGDITFHFIQKYVEEIQLAEESEIIEAMRLIWERMKIIVEPSSAITLAIVLKNKAFFKGKRIGLILSGGNVDLGKLPF